MLRLSLFVLSAVLCSFTLQSPALGQSLQDLKRTQDAKENHEKTQREQRCARAKLNPKFRSKDGGLVAVADGHIIWFLRTGDCQHLDRKIGVQKTRDEGCKMTYNGSNVAKYVRTVEWQFDGTDLVEYKLVRSIDCIGGISPGKVRNSRINETRYKPITPIRLRSSSQSPTTNVARESVSTQTLAKNSTTSKNISSFNASLPAGHYNGITQQDYNDIVEWNMHLCRSGRRYEFCSPDRMLGTNGEWNSLEIDLDAGQRKMLLLDWFKSNLALIKSKNYLR